MVTLSVFLSTHSKRSATVCFFYCCFKQPIFLSTHSKRSATSLETTNNKDLNISIHALQAECDGTLLLWMVTLSVFLSTHSKRSATFVLCARFLCAEFLSTHSKRSATIGRKLIIFFEVISIHALQAECDLDYINSITLIFYFYPRTPSGVRRLCLCRVTDTGFRFLSTHSKRSATANQGKQCLTY